MTTPDDVLLETAQGRSLHIVEDMQFQRWSWAIERVAWGSMVLVVLLALAGVFAAGPLSTATISDQASLVQIHYERFARVSAPSVLGIELAAGAVTSSAEIEIGRAFARAIQIRPDTARAIARARRSGRQSDTGLRAHRTWTTGIVRDFPHAEPCRIPSKASSACADNRLFVSLSSSIPEGGLPSWTP